MTCTLCTLKESMSQLVVMQRIADQNYTGRHVLFFKTVGTKKELATAILTSIVVNAVTRLWTKKKILGPEKRKT